MPGFSKKAYIKVFRKRRRVLILTTVKNAGKFRLKDENGRLTFIEDDVARSPRKLRLLSVRTLSLGQKSKHAIVMLTFRFSENDGEFPGDDNPEMDKDSDLIGVAARLTVTITNDPPSTNPEEDIIIEEDDPDPEEEDDAPEG